MELKENKLTIIPAAGVSRGKRSNIIWIGGTIFAAPYTKEDMKWYCGNCDREVEVPVKKQNTVCECGAYISWLRYIWR